MNLQVAMNASGIHPTCVASTAGTAAIASDSW